jgi:hypothetical protein
VTPVTVFSVTVPVTSFVMEPVLGAALAVLRVAVVRPNIRAMARRMASPRDFVVLMVRAFRRVEQDEWDVDEVLR